MTTTTDFSQIDSKLRSATLLRSNRMTAEKSSEDVRELKFRTRDPGFNPVPGQCIRIMAPGQFGNRYHPRFYSLADVEKPSPDTIEFTVCVRRCFVLDDFNGERYAGVASNYLCDLPIGSGIEFAGPVGYPFAPPADRKSNVLMIGMGTGIAPFRGLVRAIYEQLPRWEGQVRLFYGARSGLEMLYMNDENRDLAVYFDQPSFKAFQAMSPRPAFNAPAALDRAIEENAAEVWSLLQAQGTHVYIAGTQAMLEPINNVLGKLAGTRAALDSLRRTMAGERRWAEILY